MASTLTVETGAGVAGADSFVAAADFLDWLSKNHGLTPTWTEAEVDAALRRASRFLSASFRWKGAAKNGRTQGLAWPRKDAVDYYGEAIADDEVPYEIVQSTMILGKLEAETPGALTPVVTVGTQVKREQLGPISTEFFGGADASAFAPTATEVQSLVAPLIAKPVPKALVV